MKHVFMTLAAALIALPTFAEQKKPQQTPAPEATTVKSSKSNSSDRTAGSGEGAGQTGQPPQDTRRKFGRVLSQQGRMFTVISDGKELTFSGAKLKELPKVGENVEITFTQTPGGPLEATTVKGSKSNSSERAKSSPSPPAGR